MTALVYFAAKRAYMQTKRSMTMPSSIEVEGGGVRAIVVQTPDGGSAQ
jgi:hypothetical protein